MQLLRYHAKSRMDGCPRASGNSRAGHSSMPVHIGSPGLEETSPPHGLRYSSSGSDKCRRGLSTTSALLRARRFLRSRRLIFCGAIGSISTVDPSYQASQLYVVSIQQSCQKTREKRRKESPLAWSEAVLVRGGSRDRRGLSSWVSKPRNVARNASNSAGTSESGRKNANATSCPSPSSSSRLPVKTLRMREISLLIAGQMQAIINQ